MYATLSASRPVREGKLITLSLQHQSNTMGLHKKYKQNFEYFNLQHKTFHSISSLSAHIPKFAAPTLRGLIKGINYSHKFGVRALDR